MATRYNYTGGIVTDGLILNLDAAKTDSYQGSGTTWYDISGNNNNAEMVITPSFTGVSKEASFILEGGSITATGQVDSFAIIDSVELDNMTAIGIETWMKIDQVQAPGANMIFSKRTLNTNGYVGFFTSTGYTYRIGTVSPSQLSWATTPATGAWIQNFITVGPSGGNVYQNGSPVASDPSYVGNFSNIGTTAGLLIGDVNPNNSTLFGFKGRVASFRMYNTRLSQFDVWQNFNSYRSRYGIPDIVTDGLVLNLDAGNPYSYLQGTSGTTWTDVSGEGNNGTLENGTSYSNGSIVFDGSDDYVNLNSFSSLLTTYTNVSFNIVFKTSYTPFYTYGNLLFGSNPSNGTNAYRIGVSNTGSIFMSVSNSDSVASDQFSLGTNLNNGNYHSLSICQNSGTYNLYVDGLYIGDYINNPQDWTRAQQIQIGAEYDGLSLSDYFNGSISVVQIYSRTLSAQEVLQNFNALKGRYGIS